MDEETRRINRLLSGGKLSGPEADEIIEKVLAELAREKSAKVRPFPIRHWAGAALAAAAAVMLVVFLPRGPSGMDGPYDPEEGDLTPSALSVTCSGGALSACPMSSSLVFSLSGKRLSGFLSAYAEPVGHEAERVFYFSKEDGSVELAWPPDAEHEAKRIVRLSALHEPGRYRIHALLADQPQPRSAMTGGELIPGARATARVEMVVVE